MAKWSARSLLCSELRARNAPPFRARRWSGFGLRHALETTIVSWKASHDRKRQTMKANPYAPPRLVEEVKPNFDLAGNCGVPREGFLKYRLAAACQSGIIAVFFLLACFSMVQSSMAVDALIGLTMPIAMLFVMVKVLRARTAADLGLSLKRYRSVSARARTSSVWLGLTLFAAGVVQLLFVPPQWQMFPWSFVVCGPATVGCAFIWPPVEATP